MTVQAVTAQEDIQAQLRDPATATPWRTSELYTAEEVDALVAAAVAAAIATLGITADVYTPKVYVNGVEDPALAAALGPFTYVKVGAIIRVMGTIVGGATGAVMNDDITFDLPLSAGANGTGEGVLAAGNVAGNAGILTLSGGSNTKALSNFRAWDIDEGLLTVVDFQYHKV